MNNNPVLQEYYHLLDERAEEIKIHLATAKCKTFDEYKLNCGKIEGLDASKDILKQAIKNCSNDFDEDD